MFMKLLPKLRISFVFNSIAFLEARIEHTQLQLNGYKGDITRYEL